MASKENNMKRVTVLVDKELDYQFRKLASRKFKFEIKWYIKALRKAITMWIEANPDEEE